MEEVKNEEVKSEEIKSEEIRSEEIRSEEIKKEGGVDVSEVLVMEDYTETEDSKSASRNSGKKEPKSQEPGLYPEDDWEAIIEAVLFTMGQSVELRQLAAAIDQDEKTTEQAVAKLIKRYEKENRGLQIIELEKSYQMCTKARFYDNLIRVAATPKKQVLTEVVLETLSIIAYKQPVTKMEIEKIRGVKSDHAVNRLIEYNLVQEVGRLDAPGRPALFATTEEFLRRFGIGSKENLPDMDPVRAEEIRNEVEEEMKVQIEEMNEQEKGEEGDANE